MTWHGLVLSIVLAAGSVAGCDRGPVVPKPGSAPDADEVSPPKQGDLTPGRLADPAPPRAPRDSGVGGTR